MSILKIDFVRLAIKGTLPGLSWYRENVSDLRHAKSELVREWLGPVEIRRELFTAVQEGVGIIPWPSHIMAVSGGPYTLLNQSDYSVLNVIFQAEKDEDRWNDAILTEERKNKGVYSMCDDWRQWKSLKQGISITWNSNNGLQVTFFSLLGYNTLLSWPCVTGVMIMVRGKISSCWAKTLLQKCSGTMNWTCRGEECVWIWSVGKPRAMTLQTGSCTVHCMRSIGKLNRTFYMKETDQGTILYKY